MYKRYHIFLIGIALVTVSALTSMGMLFFQGGEHERLRTLIESSAIQERLYGVFTTINDFPGSAGKDMLFLRSLSSISALYNNFKIESWHSVHEDLQQFIERNEAYDEIHIHGTACMFTARRIQDEDGNTSCSSANKAVEDAVLHTLNLPQGAVYLSPLGAYAREIHGKESTIPAILYGTRVSAPGSEDGVIVAVVNANYFLEEVRRLKRDGENVFLLNIDGSYIANFDPAKENLSGSTANFYEDFPMVPKGALENPQVRQFETSEKLFTFMRITPTANNFALYDSAENSSSGSEKGDQSYWIMAAVSEKAHQGAWWFNNAYLTTIIIILGAHLIVIILMYVTLFPTKTLSDLFHRQKLFKEDVSVKK